MKAKLIKTYSSYYLYVDGNIIASNEEVDGKQKLSLKNCQAIERGYDLDELAQEEYCSSNNPDFDFDSYFKGFQKALEILGDRRFTEEDMINAFLKGVSLQADLPTFQQSLQQNEWEVEVEMEPVFDIEYSNNGYRTEKFNKTEYKPKLDADGCLILKRVL